ncbi:MAG: glycosyltransferase family 2 protein, partial [Parcubacteria group bacterium]
QGSHGTQSVTLVRYEGRLGKTECQNRMVAGSSAEVVVFSDGNVHWAPGALSKLVAPFADTTVAATTGALHLKRGEQTEQINEGLFRRLDHLIKKGESSLLSTIGVNGPVYAVRRKDYIRLQPHLVSDLVLPVLLIARGRRVFYVPQAQVLEPAAPTIWHEFRRKRRLVTQGLVALPLLLRASHPLRQPWLFFLLLSHKILRWFGVELLIFAFIATLALIYLPLFQIVLSIELVLLAAAGLGLLFLRNTPKSPSRSRLLSALSFFVLTNTASLLGAYDYLRGHSATRWRTERT